MTTKQKRAAAHGSASTHDYTKRHWGHDYTITDVRKRGIEISMMGWGHGISEGDYMLIEGQSSEPGANPDTRYRVKTIRYLGDPPDMWSMEATFAPRVTPNAAGEPQPTCDARKPLSCVSCLTELTVVDDDPNGEHNAVCAKCRAEENHDFDAEPNAQYGRDGRRIR